jgi:hypothetical protein
MKTFQEDGCRFMPLCHDRKMGWALSSSPAKFGWCCGFVNGKLLAGMQGICANEKPHCERKTKK